jgi:hypothetical protein
MSKHTLAAEIVRRIPAMAHEIPENNEVVILALIDQHREDNEDFKEALSFVQDMVAQSCHCQHGEVKEGTYHSMCLSTYADAMRLLARHGRFKIMVDRGPRVIGRFV